MGRVVAFQLWFSKVDLVRMVAAYLFKEKFLITMINGFRHALLLSTLGSV